MFDPSRIIKGASIKKQKQWANFSSLTKKAGIKDTDEPF